MYNEEFANRILNKVREQFPDKKIEIKDVRKNNNMIEHGLIIGSGINRDIAPTIYIDRFMKDEEDAIYSQEYLDNTIEYIKEQYEISQKEIAHIQSMVDSLTEFDKIKDRIYFNLVNNDKNKDFLKGVPHRKFLDLAIIYRVLLVNSHECGIADAIVQNEILKQWGDITEEELYKLAMKNTPKMFEFESQKVSDLLNSVLGDKYMDIELPTENMLIMVSNKQKHKGSYVMLYQDYIREVIKEHNLKKAYILPSSIHEVILLLDDPQRGLVNALELLDMVRTVNRNEVHEHEILADSVYEITLTDDISIAASSRPWKGGWDY